MSVGLSKQQIIDMLTEANINDAKPISTEELKEAIAKVIVENNTIIERNILAEIKRSATKVVNDDLKNAMRRRGY